MVLLVRKHFIQNKKSGIIIEMLYLLVRNLRVFSTKKTTYLARIHVKFKNMVKLLKQKK